MFDAMPPGQLATRMIPTASPVSRPKSVATPQPMAKPPNSKSANSGWMLRSAVSPVVE